MIDWDFEDRLIERVDARAAAAKALDPRQRRLLRAHALGATYRDIAETEGLSAGRIQQINERSIERLRKWVRGWRPPPPPPPKPAPKPKPYVDPALARQRMLARERRLLREMLEAEEAERAKRERFLKEAAQASRRREIIEAHAKALEADAKAREAIDRHRAAAQDRSDWVRALWEAIARCEGTHYAPLIPQMMGDIAKIEAMPPGPLPWRFDRSAFYAHLNAFMAQIDAGTYRPLD